MASPRNTEGNNRDVPRFTLCPSMTTASGHLCNSPIFQNRRYFIDIAGLNLDFFITYIQETSQIAILLKFLAFPLVPF